MKVLNEKKLSALIKKDCTRIVNVFDDHLQYSNGYIIVNFDYECHTVIQTLFKLGALTDYRKFISTKTVDLSKFNNRGNEVDAIKTPFMKDLRYVSYIFKINGKYYPFNADYVDIFKDVTYKAMLDEDSGNPFLAFYDNDKFVGLLLPIRDFNDKETESVLEYFEDCEVTA